MKIDKNKITSYKYLKKDSEIGTNIFKTDNYYVIGKQEKVSIYSINVYFDNAAENIRIYPDPSINIDLINNEIDENGWFTITLPYQSLGSGGIQGGYFLSFDESHLSKLKIKYSYNDSLYIKLDYMYLYTGGTSIQQLSDVDSVLTNLTFTIVCGDSDKIYFSDDVYVNGNLAIDKCIGTLIKQDNNKQKIYDNIPVEYNHLYHIVATHKPYNGTFNHHYLYLHNTHDPGRATCTANLFAITSNTSQQDANDGPSVCMILNDDTTIKVKIHYAGSYSIDDTMSLDRFTYDTDDNHCTQCLTVYDLGIYLGVDRQLNP